MRDGMVEIIIDELIKCNIIGKKALHAVAKHFLFSYNKCWELYIFTVNKSN